VEVVTAGNQAVGQGGHARHPLDTVAAQRREQDRLREGRPLAALGRHCSYKEQDVLYFLFCLLWSVWELTKT